MSLSSFFTTGRRPPLQISHGPGTDSDDDIVALLKFRKPSKLNAPNAISMMGYAATLGWLGGAPAPLAIFGLVADEADGRIARATGTTSDYGGLLDWAIDLTLTGLVLARLGWTWMLLPITPLQVYLRDRGVRPTIGSARALFTVIALAKGG